MRSSLRFKSILVTVLGLMFFASMAYAKNPMVGKTLFLKTNIWYEQPERMFSTNYHKGTMIPAGSKVNVTKISGKAIKFDVLDGGPSCMITYVAKYSKPGMTSEDYAKLIFSEEDPLKAGGAYDRFSDQERQNIKAGEVAAGMSKEAVLMAFGYPPGHKTPSLDSDQWTYWLDRFKTRVVSFEKNRVIDISR